MQHQIHIIGHEISPNERRNWEEDSEGGSDLTEQTFRGNDCLKEIDQRRK